MLCISKNFFSYSDSLHLVCQKKTEIAFKIAQGDNPITDVELFLYI